MAREYEGNTGYLGIKGTIGVIVKVCPPPRAGYTALTTAEGGNPVTMAMAIPQPFALATHAQYYTSAYTIGDEDATTIYTDINPAAQAAFYGHTSVIPYDKTNYTVNV